MRQTSLVTRSRPHEVYLAIDEGTGLVTDTFYIYVRGIPDRRTYTKTDGNCRDVTVAITVSGWTNTALLLVRDSVFLTITSSQGPTASFRLPKGIYTLFTRLQDNSSYMQSYVDTLIISEGIDTRAIKYSKGQGNYLLETDVSGEEVKSYAWYKIVNGNKEDLQLNTETIQVNSWNTETFRVIVTANSGCMDSADFEFQANPNGLELVKSQVRVYPNPANKSIHIQIENGQIMNLQLWSLDGKILQETKAISAKEFQLETSELPNGIYLLKCLLEDGSQEYTRVVVQH